MLEKWGLLGTEPEPAFDRVTRLAVDLLGVESAGVNFAGTDRQWFKSAIGLDETETGLENSFCAYTIEQAERMVVEDAVDDDRFKDNPYVVGQGVRFYAGIPLAVEDSPRVGTLCVMDSEPRSPSEEALRQLGDLAAMVEGELELRKETADHERARRDLEENRALFEHAEELAMVGGWTYDPQADTLAWTDETYRIHGLSPDRDIDVETAISFYAPESRSVIRSRVEALLERGGQYDVELDIVTADGERRHVRSVGKAYRTGGEITRIGGAIQDITERLRRKQELRSERNFLDRILETTPAAIAVLDTEGVFVEASGRTEEVLGVEKEEVIGLRYNDPEWNIRGPDGEPMSDETLPFARIMATKEPVRDVEFMVERSHGATRLLSVSGAPLYSPDGELEGAVFHLDDTTERREAERELERQNDLFAKAQDLARVGGWEYDVETGDSTLTEEVYRIHGLSSAADLSPERSIEYVHPDDRRAIREAFRRAAEDGAPYDLELRLITEEGEHRWVRTRGEPKQEDGEVTRVRGTIQDITEQHRQKAKLRARQGKLEVLYEATSRLLQANSEDEVADLLITLIGDTLGYSGTTIRFVEEERLAASRMTDMVRGSMPERPAYALDGDTPAATAYRTGETQAFDDLSAVRPDFDRGEIRATAYVPMGKHGLISVGSREVGGIGSFDLSLIEILGGYAALVLERLDRVEALRQAKDAAEEADRIKAALLSNMNHELRTPLTSIVTFARLIDQNPGAAGQFSGRILGGAHRLLYTLNTVMEFAELEGEIQSGQPPDMSERCKLDEAVRSVADDYRTQAHQKGLELEVEASQSGTTYLDSHLLERVLTHLLDNSVKFTEEGQVRVRATVSEEVVEVQVDDTGVGIDPDFVPRACDEFAQASTGLSRQYEGNGLGLTVKKRLVERVGGDIEIESEEGQGTRVTVRLPTGG